MAGLSRRRALSSIRTWCFGTGWVKVMRLLVVNPNTNRDVTVQIGRIARDCASRETEVVAVSPEAGPLSIECHADETLAAARTLELLAEPAYRGFDAYVIACFGDPALFAARQLLIGPVIGIAEAALHVATMIATRFSIVTSLQRTAIMSEELLARYGFARHCRRVRAVDLAVAEIAGDSGVSGDAIAAECRRARDEDQIGAIVLGCAGMARFAGELTTLLGLPVIDGVAAGVRLAEALVGGGWKTSKFGDFAAPPTRQGSGT
jgi:allantoin racemase